jgi:hypothetical protein
MGPRSYSKELWRKRQGLGIHVGKGWRSYVAPADAASPSGAIGMGVSKSILNVIAVVKKCGSLEKLVLLVLVLRQTWEGGQR